MILRPSSIMWIMVWVVAAFGLYMVKYKVQAIKVEVASAEKHLHEEQKNLHVLMAEWTFLNRPERLRQLSAKYLEVKPLHSQQVADFSSFPYRRADNVIQHASDTAAPLAEGIVLTSGASHEE
jgi:hypothetical protein